jgi:hypothetical protein
MNCEVAIVFMMSSAVRTTFALGAAELAALELAEEALDVKADDLTDAEALETLETLDEDGKGGSGVATG